MSLDIMRHFLNYFYIDDVNFSAD